MPETETLQTSSVPRDNPSILLYKAQRLLRFFDVDASEWSRIKIFKWIFLKTFLFITAFGLGIYTVKISWPLVIDYAQSPSSYTQKIVYNESIALPVSKVCLPLSPFELDDYWKEKNDSLPSNETIHYQAKLTEFLDAGTKETLLNQEWPHFLLLIVHHYLNLILQYEALNNEKIIQDHYLSFVADYNTISDTLWIKQVDALNDSYNDLMAAIVMLDDRMAILNISAYELKSKYDAEIKALFNFTTIYQSFLLEHVPVEVDISSFSSFKEGYCCFIVSLDQYPLKRKESFWIQARRSYLPNPRFDNWFQMTIGIGGRLSDGQYNLYWKACFDSWVYGFPLQVATTYKSMLYRDGDMRCNENKSFDACTIECRRNYLQEKCDCIPTIGRVVSSMNDLNHYFDNLKEFFYFAKITLIFMKISPYIT